jgi:hypothetical protein
MPYQNGENDLNDLFVPSLYACVMVLLKKKINNKTFTSFRKTGMVEKNDIIKPV